MIAAWIGLRLGLDCGLLNLKFIVLFALLQAVVRFCFLSPVVLSKNRVYGRAGCHRAAKQLWIRQF
jgi:hypothetical protein